GTPGPGGSRSGRGAHAAASASDAASASHLRYAFPGGLAIMPVDKELLEILACPVCKTPVVEVKNGTALKCNQCKRVYPIKDDIPVMLVDEATIES
ncbi:MAG: Trm112 family protein, partial [Vicinamibacterales bacterium]